MSKHTYKKEIEREIQRINEVIDFKILHGIQYRDETKIHRKLLAQLGSFRSKNIRFRFLGLFF